MPRQSSNRTGGLRSYRLVGRWYLFWVCCASLHLSTQPQINEIHLCSLGGVGNGRSRSTVFSAGYDRLYT